MMPREFLLSHTHDEMAELGIPEDLTAHRIKIYCRHGL